MRKLLVVVILVALVAAGVYFYRRGAPGTGDAGGGASIAVDPAAPLAFVPADTPYVFANLEPFPADVSARWMSQMDALVPLWRVQLSESIDTLAQQGGREDELKWLRAVHAEIDGKSLAQVFETLGYDLRGHFAFYGIGLAPVLRVSLADPAKFRAFVGRLEQAGGALPRAQLDAVEYWSLAAPDAKLRGVLALQGEHLLMTLAPVGDEAALRTLLGVERPANDLRDGASLRALNSQFGYLPFASGYIDNTRIVALLTGPSSPLESAFLAALGVEKPAPDPVCAGEYAALAAAAPRISSGYTALEAKRMDMVTRFELAKPIAADLQTLRAPMPGMAQADDSAFNLGVSFRIGAVPDLVAKWASAVAAAPWKCPTLQPLNASFAEARTQVAHPLVFGAAPVFHGVHAIATKLAIKPDAATPDVAGKLVIGSPNPAALLQMAKGFVPTLATLTVPNDGSVQRLPSVPTMPPDMPAFVAMRDQVLAIAVGAGEDEDLADYLVADPAQQPLLVLGYSGALFGDFNRTLIAQAAATQTPEQQAEQQRAADAVAALYAEIERAEIRVEFGPDGIELRQNARLR